MLLTVKQVAKLLNVNDATVRKWISEGKLAAVKIGRIIRVEEKEVFNFVEENTYRGE